MPSSVQARAARTGTRWSASIAAASASRPTRSPETTVTRAPSGEASTLTDTPRGSRRTASGTGTSSASEDQSSGRPSVASAARQRAASWRTRLARHVDQALGEVAFASASVSASSRSSTSVVPIREVTDSTVAGSSGSRVAATSESSRWRRTSLPTRSVSCGPKPIRVAMSRAIGSPATLCSVSSPLPMSCSSAATTSTSGRAT